MPEPVFSYYKPSYPLDNLVELFWLWQGKNLLQGRECALPSATVELVISLNSGRLSDSVVCGPRSSPFIIENKNEERLLGIHFRPGGAFPFLPFPFWDLHNSTIGIADLWGESRSHQLLTLLNEAPTVDDKFRRLEAWLVARMVASPEHHAAVKFSLNELMQPEALSTADLAERVNLSQRRFIQIFRNQVGMTPKLFSRVQRFQGVLDSIDKRAEIDWLDVSMQAGYFDQAHFIHDFREFAGITPTKYASVRTEHRNHLPANS